MTFDHYEADSGLPLFAESWMKAGEKYYVFYEEDSPFEYFYCKKVEEKNKHKKFKELEEFKLKRERR